MSRTLEDWETDLLNKSAAFEAEMIEFIEAQFSTGSCDDRWLAIARTDLQKGFMALNRAIAKPGDTEVPQDFCGTSEPRERILLKDVVHDEDGEVLAVKAPDDRVPRESDIRDIPPATGAEIIEEMTKPEEPCLGAQVRKLGLTGEGEGNYD